MRGSHYNVRPRSGLWWSRVFLPKKIAFAIIPDSLPDVTLVPHIDRQYIFVSVLSPKEMLSYIGLCAHSADTFPIC